MKEAFAIYLGWVFAASIVCTSQALKKWGYYDNSCKII